MSCICARVGKHSQSQFFSPSFNTSGTLLCSGVQMKDTCLNSGYEKFWVLQLRVCWRTQNFLCWRKSRTDSACCGPFYLTRLRVTLPASASDHETDDPCLPSVRSIKLFYSARLCSSGSYLGSWQDGWVGWDTKHASGQIFFQMSMLFSLSDTAMMGCLIHITPLSNSQAFGQNSSRTITDSCYRLLKSIIWT